MASALFVALNVNGLNRQIWTCLFRTVAKYDPGGWVGRYSDSQTLSGSLGSLSRPCHDVLSSQARDR